MSAKGAFFVWVRSAKGAVSSQPGATPQVDVHEMKQGPTARSINGGFNSAFVVAPPVLGFLATVGWDGLSALGLFWAFVPGASPQVHGHPLKQGPTARSIADESWPVNGVAAAGWDGPSALGLFWGFVPGAMPQAGIATHLWCWGTGATRDLEQTIAVQAGGDFEKAIKQLPPPPKPKKKGGKK